jgi:hypothetical protein
VDDKRQQQWARRESERTWVQLELLQVRWCSKTSDYSLQERKLESFFSSTHYTTSAPPSLADSICERWQLLHFKIFFVVIVHCHFVIMNPLCIESFIWLLFWVDCFCFCFFFGSDLLAVLFCLVLLMDGFSHPWFLFSGFFFVVWRGWSENNWEPELLSIIIIIIYYYYYYYYYYYQAMWSTNKIQKSFFVCKWKKKAHEERTLDIIIIIIIIYIGISCFKTNHKD